MAITAARKFLSSPYGPFLLASICLSFLWILAVWVAIGLYHGRQIEAAIADGSHEAEHLSAGIALGIERNLTLRQGTTFMLAEERLIRQFTAARCQQTPRSRGQDATSPQSDLNAFLAAAESHLELDALWLGGADGRGIAAAKAQAAVSPIGIDYSDRAYYQAAKAGHAGFQYAFGRTTQMGGIYFSAPVVIDRSFCGFVLLKINTPSLYPWIDQANAVLADSNGVIIAAKERRLEMTTLSGASVSTFSEAARLKQYGRAEFQELPLGAWKAGQHRALKQIGDDATPLLVHTRQVGSFPLLLTVFQPLTRLADIDRETQYLFSLASTLGVLFITVLTGIWGYLKYVRFAQGQLRQQKQQLDEAQRLALLGSWERDIRATSLTWSNECRQMFESEPSRDAITLDEFRAKIHPDDRAAFDRAFEKSIAQRQPGSIEHRLVLGGGRIRTVQQRWLCQFDAQGQPTRCFGFVQDITERKALEEDLRRSNAELEQFAYAASHDLREPLRMVSSFVSLLEKKYADKLDSEAHEFIAFARDGALRMDSLISGLLNYSRIGHSNEPFQPVSLDIALKEALLNLTTAIEACQGVVRIDSALPTVMGERSELVRLFQNLVANALKYRSPGKAPEIFVKGERQGLEWLLTVQDNGIGIPSEHQERIFGIFQRLHGHSQYEGAGIGLAVCKKIVERHQGRIWVESESGQGSRFCFTLPACD